MPHGINWAATSPESIARLVESSMGEVLTPGEEALWRAGCLDLALYGWRAYSSGNQAYPTHKEPRTAHLWLYRAPAPNEALWTAAGELVGVVLGVLGGNEGGLTAIASVLGMRYLEGVAKPRQGRPLYDGVEASWNLPLPSWVSRRFPSNDLAHSGGRLSPDQAKRFMDLMVKKP